MNIIYDLIILIIEHLKMYTNNTYEFINYLVIFNKLVVLRLR